MNGGAGSSEHSFARGGRHRRRGDEGWTPGVVRRASPARHASLSGTVDISSRNLLPVTPPVGDTDAFPPSRGQLPVARAKVTLTPTEPTEPEDTEVVVPLVAPATGLGTFDLGSVPASVTPPRSWRRAAWFATASSGGVVVALLFAGSALVSKPALHQPAIAWVPGLGGGGQPTLDQEHSIPSPDRGATGVGSQPRNAAPAPSVSSTPVRPAAEEYRPPRKVPAAASPGDDTTSPASPPTSTAPGQGYIPPKPPASHAPYDADPFQVALPQAAPAVLAENSQKFFDTVTEDPAAAHELTTGHLRREGTEALARQYADVAYFEVEHVQVHQYEGKTVCTMRAVYKDGRRTTEQRTLTFDHGKIEHVD